MLNYYTQAQYDDGFSNTRYLRQKVLFCMLNGTGDWMTCGLKTEVGGIFSFFGTFLFHVICPKILVLKLVFSSCA